MSGVGAVSRAVRRPRARVALATLALISAAAFVAPRLAGATVPASWTPQGALTASDASVNDSFGRVVLSGSGTTAVVGAFGKTVQGNHVAGVVYVFVKNAGGWVQQAELTPSDAAPGDYFGSSVATTKDGSTVVVGAPFKTVGGKNHAGAAYVFTRSGTTWTQTAALTGAPPGPGNFFGTSVAINGVGTIAAVAAPSKNVTHLRHAGAVYVYKRVGATWSQTGFLTEPEPATGDYFGWAIGAKETQVVASSPFHTNADGSSGAVYGFDDPGGGYVHLTTLTAGDGQADDGFGASLDISVATMVVGAPHHLVDSQRRGAVYVFTHSDRTGIWKARTEIAPSDSTTDDSFGNSVSISGTVLAIGDEAHTVGVNPAQGVVYVFAGAASSWAQQAELTAADGGANTYFGQWIAASSATVMVGETAHAVGGMPGAGLVDLFVSS